MPTIAKGNTAEIYVPVAGSVTFTPGSGGRVEFACSVGPGGGEVAPRTLYAATTISIPAGSTVFAVAIGADATYTQPAGVGQELSDMVEGAGNSVFDASLATLSATLVPGEAYSFTVPVYPAYYRVDTEMDCYVKASSASGIYGLQLADDTDAYSTTAGSLAAQTGLDFGVSSYGAEAWVQLASNTTNGARVLGFGAAGAARLDLYMSNASTGNVRVGCELVGNSGVAIKSDIAANDLGATYPLGGSLYHLYMRVIRAAGGGTGYLRYYLNGVQVQQASWTEAGTPTSFDLSSVVAGSGRLVLGGTVGGNAEWDGRIEDIKFYNTDLTVSQIQARALAGPVRALGLDAADASLKWWVSFQNSGAWANALYPECVPGYGNAVFNSKIGAGSVSQRTGGAAATPQDSARVYASRPQKIYCPLPYLSVLGDAASGGRVALTRAED